MAKMRQLIRRQTKKNDRKNLYYISKLKVRGLNKDAEVW